MSIIIKETIPGCGKEWFIEPIRERQEWLMENIVEDEYRVWYGGTSSDERYTRFNNEEDATIYKIKWGC